MRFFLMKVGCFVAIQALVFFVVMKYGSEDATNNHYLYALKDKADLLRTTPSPRIIFAGGSNLAFGLNSEIVKKQTGYHPINLGLHAQLGICPLLRLMSKHLRDGDVVVLSPEFHIMFTTPRCAEDLGLELLSVWPESRDLIEPDLNVDLDQAVQIDSPLKRLAAATKRARKILSGKTKNEKVCENYTRAGFNSFGDHIAHHAIDPPDFNPYPLRGFNEVAFQRFAAEVNQFADLCAANNCKVVLACPPVRMTDADADAEYRPRLQRALAESLNIQVITTADDIVLADRLFYDCPMHLNARGAEIRTQRLCRSLDRFNLCRQGASSGESDGQVAGRRHISAPVTR